MDHKPKKIVAIVQARMGSKRLPKKSLMKIGNRFLVDHVLLRLKNSLMINEIVLAIPDNAENEVLEKRAISCGVQFFKGSEDDLVGRFFAAALKFKADIVVRVCADNPFVHYEEVDRIIEYFLKNDHIDFASNVGPVMGNCYPDGLGAEVFSFKSLEWIHKNMHDAHCREHVHENFYRNPKRFQLGTIQCPEHFSFPNIVLDINTIEEFNFINKLYSDLNGDSKELSILDIIPWYQKNMHNIPETYRRGNDS